MAMSVMIHEDGEDGRDAAVVSLPLNVRVSMEDYYQRRCGSIEVETAPSEPPSESPPSYEAFLLSPTLSRKYNIQPREDEGRETLPAYSCAISLESVFMKKMELEGAVHTAHDRSWYKVFVTLQGTALSFHKYKGPGTFQMPKSGPTSSPDHPTGAKKCQLLRSYNLQHADVGIAADYFKKKYVIRVRAEADQFLLSCQKIETFVLWLQSLFTAIDLAPPLDDRPLPRDLSIPRPRRRRIPRSNVATAAMDRSAELAREQQEMLRTQYPRLADTIPEEAIPLGRISTRSSASRPAISIEERPASSSSQYPPEDREIMLVSRSHTALSTRSNSQTSDLSDLSDDTRNPSIVPETGKWRPEHQWGPLYDMQYAKRCMATLTCRSPRKSNFVIMKGKQWIVDWATGVLTRWEPPEYGEAVGRSGRGMAKEEWRVGQYGEVITA